MMWDDDDLTPEDQNDQYLRDNPGVESALWTEWVLVVCQWDNIPPPSSEEWDVLRSKFYHGKMPITSVAELKSLRENKCTSN
jgi:hypothetical protein